MFATQLGLQFTEYRQKIMLSMALVDPPKGSLLLTYFDARQQKKGFNVPSSNKYVQKLETMNVCRNQIYLFSKIDTFECRIDINYRENCGNQHFIKINRTEHCICTN